MKTSRQPRLIAIFYVDTFGARRRMVANNFKRRLRGLHDDDDKNHGCGCMQNNSLLSFRAVRPFRKLIDLRRDPLTKAQGLILTRWYRENIQKSSKLNFPAASGFPRALRLHGRSRRLACRWNLGTSPSHYCFLCRIGLRVYLDDLNLLKKRRPSKMEGMNIRAALDVVDSISEVNIFIRGH